MGIPAFNVFCVTVNELFLTCLQVMAMVVEGKRNKRQFRNRRPNSANYHKLDSNLEEALTSTCNKNSNQIIY